MGSTLLVLMLIFPYASVHRRAVHARQPAPAAFTAQDVTDAASTDTLSAPSGGPRVMRAQILLDRARFSPGEIDARFGEVLEIAVQGYQRSKGLEITGL